MTLVYFMCVKYSLSE